DDRRRLVAYLQMRAEGNQFFTGELLRALEVERALRPSDGDWQLGDLTRVRVPYLLRQVIDGRVARLEDDVQQLLAVAAVIGHNIPLTVWQAVSETGRDALLRVVEQAEAARLLEETRDGTGARFVHALIRETFYERTKPIRRRD